MAPPEASPLRAFPVAALALLLAPALVALAPAEAAAAGPAVDAGASVRAPVGEPFTLSAHAEGFDGPIAFSWTTDDGCALQDPSLAVVVATCAEPGTHAFLVSAADALASATDEVRVVVTLEETVELLRTSGHTTLGLPDEHDTVTGPADRASMRYTFTVPEGLVSLTAVLDWTSAGALTTDQTDFDLQLRRGGVQYDATGTARPARVHVDAPPRAFWQAVVMPRVAHEADWTLEVTALRLAGDASLPLAQAAGASAVPGETVTLSATAAGGTPPYAFAWETTPGSRRFDDGAGETLDVAFTGPTTVAVKATDAAGFESVAYARLTDASDLAPRPLTVVAVIDNGFSPYHYDFLGSQHPWNRDDDPANDLDFGVDPARYLPGHPGGTRLDLTLPTAPDEDVDVLRKEVDAATWAAFPDSDLSTGVDLVWFPGTKVVGALRFGSAFENTNAAHGTASASVAAGNLHGTCPECLFVLITGDSNQALQWVAQQPWIDVVSNSYGHSVVGGPVRDNVYLNAPVAATRQASEDGQVVVFSAGNGLLNAFDVPMFTYWSSEKGPDWIVTVGAASPTSRSTYSGAGKPVDVTSIGSAYPASGGATANGTGTHSGTSNAAPVTAGTFAKLLQRSRELLGDGTPGHAGGVVASGTPVACGEAEPECVLGDGVLTRRELQDTIFHNVLPSPLRVSVGTVWPTTQFAYYYQGHGLIHGRIDGPAAYEQEAQRFVDAAVGDVASHARPAGEKNWFTVDSKCRQRLWGSWSGGYYDGTEPTWVPNQDGIAMAFWAWCSALPVGVRS